MNWSSLWRGSAARGRTPEIRAKPPLADVRFGTPFGRYKADVPWITIKSSFHAAERLREEEPQRFDAIVSEAIAAEPELEGKDPLSLVTLYLYDQRIRT